jgi:diaminopropionate ammonia-lyase
MLFANPRAVRCAYPQALQQMLNVQGARQSLHWLSQWSGLNHGATR